MIVTLVGRHHNRLRYLCVTETDNDSAVIPALGGATPDLLTDSLAGPLKQMAKAFTQGYGLVPAGAQTQAQGRAIWNDDSSGANIGTSNITRARCRCVPRSSTAGGGAWTVDVFTGVGPASNQLYIQVSYLSPGEAISGSAYFDVFVKPAIGVQ